VTVGEIFSILIYKLVSLHHFEFPGVCGESIQNLLHNLPSQEVLLLRALFQCCNCWFCSSGNIVLSICALFQSSDILLLTSLLVCDFVMSLEDKSRGEKVLVCSLGWGGKNVLGCGVFFFFLCELWRGLKVIRL